MLVAKIVFLICVISACGMGSRSSNSWDNPRDKRYSAYVYIGDKKFRKSQCIRRGKKTGKCYEWKQHYLDLNKPEDEQFVKASMILVSEGEL